MTKAATEAPLDLQRAAREHLWLHFTRMGGFRDGQEPLACAGCFQRGNYLARCGTGENRLHLGRDPRGAAQAPQRTVAFHDLVVKALRESQCIQRAGARE